MTNQRGHLNVFQQLFDLSVLSGHTRDGTRTHNLLLRREAPYPLGHTGLIIRQGSRKHPFLIERRAWSTQGQDKCASERDELVPLGDSQMNFPNLQATQHPATGGRCFQDLLDAASRAIFMSPTCFLAMRSQGGNQGENLRNQSPQTQAGTREPTWNDLRLLLPSPPLSVSVCPCVLCVCLCLSFCRGFPIECVH